jgi:LmbE family N-acetylglucosaminyl deacetylase
MKILSVVAHPDDEVLGMGGTIKKYTDSGHDVKIVFMATGIFARRNDKYQNSTKYATDKKTVKKMKSELERLRKDAKQATKILGVDEIEFMNFPDNEMDKVSNLEITKKIENVIGDYKPTVVYTHSPYDINIDHRILYNATITATRPMSNSNVKEVISFEVPSSTEWYFPSKFTPNVFVDISDELPFKLRALEAYKNEIREFPHPRSMEALEIIAKRWGTVSGFMAAEAFSLVRELRDIS